MIVSRIKNTSLAFALGVLFLALPAQAAEKLTGLPAVPSSVIFFAREAQITVIEQVQAVKTEKYGTALVLFLPQEVLEASLNVEVEGALVSSHIWEEAPDDPISLHASKPRDSFLTYDPEKETDPKRKELLEAYLGLRKQQVEKQALTSGLEVQMTYWQNQAAQLHEGAALGLDEKIKLATALGQYVPTVKVQIDNELLALDEINRQLANARKKLEKYSTAILSKAVIIPVAPSAKPMNVTYRYVMPTRSQAHYVLSASPEKNNVNIRQIVDLTQTSGREWKDVDVSVALVARPHYPAPSDLDPWIVDFYATSSRSYAKLASAPIMEAQEKYIDISPAAGLLEQKEMTTFSLWKLGKRTISSGAPLSVELANTDHKANFFYTVRPSQTKQAFLTADLAFDTPVEMPEGEAACFIDNQFVGTNIFTVNGKEKQVFFGTDPLVTVQKKEITAKRGETGFISKSQTKVWNWEITTTNMRSRTIDVVIEEPQPVSRDESIVIKIDAQPSYQVVAPENPFANEALKVLTWKNTLKSNEKFTVNYKVTIEAPSGKSLTSSR